MGVAPALFPLALLVALALKPSPRLWAYALLYYGHSVLAFRHFNSAYLRQATPAHLQWAVPVLESLLPLQLLAAIGFAPADRLARGMSCRSSAAAPFTSCAAAAGQSIGNLRLGLSYQIRSILAQSARCRLCPISPAPAIEGAAGGALGSAGA